MIERRTEEGALGARVRKEGIVEEGDKVEQHKVFCEDGPNFGSNKIIRNSITDHDSARGPGVTTSQLNPWLGGKNNYSSGLKL